ncbi:MAG: hypothetical protein WCS15_01345 [Prevotella sp.]
MMQSDLPHTLYESKKGGNGGDDEKVVVDERSIRLNEESLRKMKARRGFSTKEVFEGKADNY